MTVIFRRTTLGLLASQLAAVLRLVRARNMRRRPPSLIFEAEHRQSLTSNKAVEEAYMGARNALAIGLAMLLASDFTARATEYAIKSADPYRHRHVHHRAPAARDADRTRTAAPPVSAVPGAALSSPVPNDRDGLSRNPEDCNMGCLDNSE